MGTPRPKVMTSPVQDLSGVQCECKTWAVDWVCEGDVDEHRWCGERVSEGTPARIGGEGQPRGNQGLSAMRVG